MNPANYREALIETASDEAEGADILLVIWLYEHKVPHYILKGLCLLMSCIKNYVNLCQVKPGLPYLDIIRLLRDNSALPIAAYQVRLQAFCVQLFLFFHILPKIRNYFVSFN
jgi:porphobilinogen synthase